jgi:hypothetical protein
MVEEAYLVAQVELESQVLLARQEMKEMLDSMDSKVFVLRIPKVFIIQSSHFLSIGMKGDRGVIGSAGLDGPKGLEGDKGEFSSKKKLFSTD